MKIGYTLALLGAALSLLASACIPGTPVPTATAAPTGSPTAIFTTSAQFVAAAWLALNTNELSQAQSMARECVDRWESDAVQQQAALTQAPPTGAVSEADKNTILSHWALNDVGASYYILGQAAEKNNQTADAIALYSKVLTFPYARVWEPQGQSFWSPAEVAKGRLAHLKP